MQIKWTNFADKMPPDEKIIMNDIGGCLLFEALRPKMPKEFSDKFRWTTFTIEKWEYLNK